jgi:hypothetical protein
MKSVAHVCRGNGVSAVRHGLGTVSAITLVRLGPLDSCINIIMPVSLVPQLGK